MFPTIESVESRVPAVAEFIDRIKESIAIAKDNHLTAKTIQTRQANRSRRPDPGYKEGDMVLLDSRNIRKRIKKTGKTAKFYPRYIGPFKVIEAWPNTSTYKLELLPTVDFDSIHPVFHTKLLRPHVPNDPERFPDREPPRPLPIIPEDEQYEVESIVDHRTRRGKNQYLVHWLGWEDAQDSWVNEEDIDEKLVLEYRNSITS